jgi:hypothetical protein
MVKSGAADLVAKPLLGIAGHSQVINIKINKHSGVSFFLETKHISVFLYG